MRSVRLASATCSLLLASAFFAFGSSSANGAPGTDPPTGAAPLGAPTPHAAWVAHVRYPVRALAAPGHGPLKALIGTSTSWSGGPVALLVLDARAAPSGVIWLRVLLPRRPNGASAWIDAESVELSLTPWRIDVSLEKRTVTLRRAGRQVDSWPAVIGAPGTPTPRGLFAIYERDRQPDPNAFLGSWALDITGFSNVLHHFEGGPGRVAIHGRGGASLRDPLGSARSHGCIRIDNSAVDVLARDATEGTPVEIG